ncbi:MAG TPA: hypothetical protein VFS44_09725 [Gemmatimonadaceae bacterium]|nr:hypothetical protein [Gemmatimonadaceae bacterium]
MSDEMEHPQRGYTTSDVAAQRRPASRPARRWRWKLILALAIAVPVLLFAAYVWGALHYTYSQGHRAGYVQKFSKKGWVCKTWEGELAMANLPGTMPEIFRFTVRDDSVAALLSASMGRRVSLTYDQHRGVPTHCFGETEYYVTGVQTTPP